MSATGGMDFGSAACRLHGAASAGRDSAEGVVWRALLRIAQRWRRAVRAGAQGAAGHCAEDSRRNRSRRQGGVPTTRECVVFRRRAHRAARVPERVASIRRQRGRRVSGAGAAHSLHDRSRDDLAARQGERTAAVRCNEEGQSDEARRRNGATRRRQSHRAPVRRQSTENYIDNARPTYIHIYVICSFVRFE